MQIKIFTIPIHGEECLSDELNHFLRAHKIIDIKKELAMLDGNSYWTFCVTYMPNSHAVDRPQTSSNRQVKVDYKETLDASKVPFETMAFRARSERTS